MKYIKILGIAAIAAMALMAFLGATSASATVLCKTTITEGCGAAKWDYEAGTEIVATSTNTVLTTSLANVSCEHSEVKGKTTNTGSSTETVDGPIEVLTFTKCSTTVDVIANGSLEVHHANKTEAEPKKMGTLTSKNAAVTVNLGGISCTYGTSKEGTDLGSVTDNAPSATDIDISTTVELKEGGFLCPKTGLWEGTYTVTSPNPLYISIS